MQLNKGLILLYAAEVEEAFQPFSAFCQPFWICSPNKYIPLYISFSNSLSLSILKGEPFSGHDYILGVGMLKGLKIW